MKLGFFIPELYMAGAERITVNLCNELSSSEDIYLYVLDRGGELQEDVRDEVNVIELKKNHVLTSGYELAKQTKKDELDLLHCSLPNSSLAGLIADRLVDIPVTLALHNSPQNRNEAKPHIMYFLFNFLYNDNMIKTPSKGAKEDVRRYFNTDKVVNLGNPVVDSVSETEVERDIDFLFVGRLSSQKNISNLLEAAKQLDNKFRIVICGEGEKKEYLEEKAPANVEFKGFVQDVSGYMERSKVFVLPSNYEALSTVSIEALSHGCKLVTTGCNGAKEIAGDLGQIVPKNSPNKLAEAMLYAINNSIDSSRLKEKSLDYSIERRSREHLEFFKDVIETT